MVAALRNCSGKTASGGRWDSTGPQRHRDPQRQLLLTAPPASSTASWPSPGGRAAHTFPTILWTPAPSTRASSRTRLLTADLQRVTTLRNKNLVSYWFSCIFNYLLTSKNHTEDKTRFRWSHKTSVWPAAEVKSLMSRWSLSCSHGQSAESCLSQGHVQVWVPEVKTLKSCPSQKRYISFQCQVPGQVWVPDVVSKRSLKDFAEAMSRLMRSCPSPSRHVWVEPEVWVSRLSFWSFWSDRNKNLQDFETTSSEQLRTAPLSRWPSRWTSFISPRGCEPDDEQMYDE